MSKNTFKPPVIKTLGHAAVIFSLGCGAIAHAGTANLTGQYFGKHELIMATPADGQVGFGQMARQVRNENNSVYGVLGWNMSETYWLWDFDKKTITFGGSNLAAMNFFATPSYRVYAPTREVIPGEVNPTDIEGSTDVELMKGTFVDNGDGTYSADYNFQIYLIMAGFPLANIHAKFEIKEDENGHLSIVTLDEGPDGYLGADGNVTDNVPGVVLPGINEGPGGVFPLRVSPYWYSDQMTKITTDTNGDGLPDIVSKELGLLVGSTDTDGDGISDLEEVGSNWAMPLDSDDDYIIDALEAGGAANDVTLFSNMLLSNNEKVTVTPLNGDVFHSATYSGEWTIDHGTPEQKEIEIDMKLGAHIETLPLEPQWLGKVPVWDISENSKAAADVLPINAPNGKPYIYDMGTFHYYFTSSFNDYDVYKNIEKVVKQIESAENSITSNEASIVKNEQLVVKYQGLLATAISENNASNMTKFENLVDRYQLRIVQGIDKRPELEAIVVTQQEVVAEFVDNGSYTERGIALLGNNFVGSNITSLADLEALALDKGFVGSELPDESSYEIYFEHGVPEGLKVLRLWDEWNVETVYSDDGVTPIGTAPINWQPEIEDVITTFHDDGKTITITHTGGSTITAMATTYDKKNFVDHTEDLSKYTHKPSARFNASNQRRRYELVFAHTDANRAATINNAPVISGSPSTSAEESKAYAFMPTAMDDDGDTLTFSITNKPSWASFDTATGELTGTPSSFDINTTDTVTISVSDAYDRTDLATFDLNVIKEFSPDPASVADTDSGSKSKSGLGSLFWLLMPLLTLLGFRTKKIIKPNHLSL